MREAYRILPVYAGDVSGIASALYELGGMVVIDDPSGCASTYNTHDELRWYDRESYIFLSGLNMRDAVLGNDRKLIDDITDAFFRLDPAPRFIALCNSPVPFLNGTDFRGICRIVERQCKVPAFYVPGCGMHDYTRGAGRAFLEYARRMLPAVPGGKKAGCGPGPEYDGSQKYFRDHGQTHAPESAGSICFRNPGQTHMPASAGSLCVNLLGVTPLTYGNPHTVSSLRRLLETDGFHVQSVWAMESSPEEIDASPYADVSLAVSDTGIPAAEYLHKTYGIPYVAGAPVSEKVWRRLAGELKAAVCPVRRNHEPESTCGAEIARAGSGDSESARAVSDVPEALRTRLCSPADAGRQTGSAGDGRERVSVFIGEAILSVSLAEAAESSGRPSFVLCPFEDSRPLLGERGAVFDGEEELLRCIGKIRDRYPEAEIEVFADPLYRVCLPADVSVRPLPSLALSGRMYRNEFPDCFGWVKAVEREPG